MRVLYTLDGQDLSYLDRLRVATLLRTLVVDLVASGEESRWKPFDLGNTKIGAVVRVKLDAYQTDNGKLYNGLVGTLVAMRGGRCIVQYLGGRVGDTQYHSTDVIEVLDR